jgi:glutathione S-transferase
MESTPSVPRLHVFAISHYCEKARWALELLGIEYELKHMMPGVHIQVAKDLGAAGSSLPFLVADGRVVQGSSAIIDWAETVVADTAKTLSPDPGLEAECRAIEERLDDVAGVHVRRYYYSEAMVEHPETVRPIFARDLAPAEQEMLGENWAVVRQLMMGLLDLGPEQRADSRRFVTMELDWFDALLADGRSFLVGDRLSRADITAAGLLAPLAIPDEHPTYGSIEMPPLARADLATWRDRPAVAWVREIYHAHR